MSEESFRAFSLETNPYSLLVIDKYRRLKRIYCPFYVQALVSSTRFNIGEILRVTKVQTADDKMAFEINGLAYKSSYFRII
jgi:hypothetical protein